MARYEGTDALRDAIAQLGWPTTWEEAQDIPFLAGKLVGVERQREYGPHNINGGGDRYISTSEIRARVRAAPGFNPAADLLEWLDQLEAQSASIDQKITKILTRAGDDKVARIKEVVGRMAAEGRTTMEPSEEDAVLDAAIDTMNYFSYIVRLMVIGPHGDSLWMLPLKEES